MLRRISLIFPLILLLLTAACGQVAQAPASPAVSTNITEATSTMVMPPTEVPATPTPFPTVTPFPTFTPMPTQAEQASGPTATPACVNLIEFVKNLNIGDNAALDNGTAFAKIWRGKNAGTCTWTSSYSLVYVAGDQMSGPSSVPLATEVQPGQMVDLRLDLVAPKTMGAFTGGWMLQDANGNRFGLAPDGSQPLNLTIQIKPTPWPTSS